MRRLSGAIAVGLSIFAGTAARADLTLDFAANPLTDNAILKQGPDAVNLNSRFTYNADHTLTAHYDSTQPTVKLVFPLGQAFDQNSSFTMSATFTILSSGFVSPVDFGAEAPSFGLVNSVTTGSIRASTGYYDSSFNFVEVTPGTAYDLMTVDYFPTQDNTYGGNSIDLTAIHTAQSGVQFSDLSNFSFGYASATLPLDQTITATLAYSAATHHATLNCGTGPITADLTGAAFNVDSFAITLWQDPNLSPAAPALASGSPVAANVVFSSVNVTAVPEPDALAMLACGTAALLPRRRSRRAARDSIRRA